MVRGVIHVVRTCRGFHRDSRYAGLQAWHWRWRPGQRAADANAGLTHHVQVVGTCTDWMKWIFLVETSGSSLVDLIDGDVLHSPAFRGSQTAADRNEVHPEARRCASRLSPYIRHGLISLPRLWKAVSGGPSRDVAKYRERDAAPAVDWSAGMACLDFVSGERERDGWLVNQTRMWFASHR